MDYLLNKFEESREMLSLGEWRLFKPGKNSFTSLNIYNFRIESVFAIQLIIEDLGCDIGRSKGG